MSAPKGVVIQQMTTFNNLSAGNALIPPEYMAMPLTAPIIECEVDAGRLMSVMIVTVVAAAKVAQKASAAESDVKRPTVSKHFGPSMKAPSITKIAVSTTATR